MEEKKKVLLVDDEEEVLYFLGNFLGRQGYDVTTTSKGKEAAQLAKKLKPDVIVLDVVIPDMSGGDVAAVLEEDPQTKDIPIIFLTGIMTKEEEAQIKTTGNRYIIAKPVDKDGFLGTIDRVLS